MMVLLDDFGGDDDCSMVVLLDDLGGVDDCALVDADRWRRRLVEGRIGESFWVTSSLKSIRVS